MDVNQLLEEFSRCPEVEAIAIGGSRATGVCDGNSDYDFYIYTDGEIPEDKRKAILAKYCQVIEIGNRYWETEDNGTSLDGVDMDIIYRDLDSMEKELSEVVEQGKASNGYTTCMWHNLKTCLVVYDREGRLAAMKKRFDVPYPQALKWNIIERNRKLLSGVLPSYDTQVEKAVGRRDKVSINHRVAEYLASYFDILFALNEETHPGEKRLVERGKQTLKLLPERFEENIELLFFVIFQGDVGSVLKEIAENIDVLIDEVRQSDQVKKSGQVRQLDQSSQEDQPRHVAQPKQDGGKV